MKAIEWEGTHDDDRIVFISDVWLDKVETFSHLNIILSGKSLTSHNSIGAAQMLPNLACAHLIPILPGDNSRWHTSWPYSILQYCGFRDRVCVFGGGGVPWVVV